jgi:coenzyme PQQ biosynthesis protein PqqD
MQADNPQPDDAQAEKVHAEATCIDAQQPVRLVGHARYRFDAVRAQHQLVFPEGLLVLNETGAAIVKRCDGRSLGDLLEALQRAYPDCDEAEVHQYLVYLRQRGLLADEPA